MDDSVFPMADLEEMAHIEHHCRFESQTKTTTYNRAFTDDHSIDQAETWNIERVRVYLCPPLVDYSVLPSVIWRKSHIYNTTRGRREVEEEDI